MEHLMCLRRILMTASCAVVVLAASLPAAEAAPLGGDPTGQRNQAAGSGLPQGAGLATEFSGDDGIDRHPDVIFAENFEASDYRRRWDECRDDGGAVLSLGETGVVGRRRAGGISTPTGTRCGQVRMVNTGVTASGRRQGQT